MKNLSIHGIGSLTFAVVFLALGIVGCAKQPSYEQPTTVVQKSCPSTSNCCCKTASTSDCIVAHSTLCTSDFPVPVATP